MQTKVRSFELLEYASYNEFDSAIFDLGVGQYAPRQPRVGTSDPHQAVGGWRRMSEQPEFVEGQSGALLSALLGKGRRCVAGNDGAVYIVTHNGWIRVAQWLAEEVDQDSLFSESVPFLMPVELCRARGLRKPV